jgi:hypothetical protein
MKVVIVAAILFATCLTSCKKEESADAPKVSKKELLTAKEWVVLKLEERENGGAWEDVFLQFDPCLKDNRFKFNSNFTVVYSEGANACPPNTPNQVLETETWSFNADETSIITGGIENKIIQLEAAKLVVTASETVAGIIYESRVTYTH